jgi:hypothetical protein
MITEYFSNYFDLVYRGIDNKCIRGYYPVDNCRILKNYDTSMVHKYKGDITRVKIKNDRRILHIDGIVRTEKVAPSIKKKCLNYLFNSSRILCIGTYLSLGSAIINSSLIFYIQRYKWIPLLFSSISAFIFSINIFQKKCCDNEIKKWRSVDYIFLRKNLQKNRGKNYLFIYDNQLNDKILLREEATQIWREDIAFIKYELLNSNDKIVTMEQIINNNPLDSRYIYYFYDNTLLEVSIECDVLIKKYTDLKNKYVEDCQLINDARGAQLQKIKEKHENIIHEINNIWNVYESPYNKNYRSTFMATTITTYKYNNLINTKHDEYFEEKIKINQKYNDLLNKINNTYKHVISELSMEFINVYAKISIT